MRIIGWLFGTRIVSCVQMRKTGKKWHWVQVAHNGKTLSSSETYSSRGECEDTARPVAAQLGVPLR